MKVALVAYGTRGDVQPFVCLGRALADAGHAVELTSSANGERMARAAGLPFRPFAFDAQDLLDSEDARRMLADGRMRTFFGWLQEAERPFLEHNRRVLIEASRDADVIVSGVLMVARCAAVAEARGIPMVPLHLCPTAPSRAYVPPMLPQRSLGPANRIAHNLPQWAFYRSQRDDLAELHAELGLPPPRWRRWRHGFGPEAPSLLAYSQALFPAPSDWSAGLRPAGHLEPWPALRDRLGEVGISEELDEWMRAGPPPVFFGFGSMPVLDEAATLAMIRAVSTELGVRAVVTAGWSRLDRLEEDDVFVLDTVDHQALLPRCAAAVHHGGAGTTAASAAAGIPTLVCSVMADQLFWGARCRALGIGDTVPFSKLDANRLARGLRRVLEADVRARAAAVGRQIANEDGVAVASAYVEQIDPRAMVDGSALPERYDVRKAQLAMATDLAGTLARAFYDDPLFAWLLPDPSRRVAILRRGFELYLSRVWLRHEETYTVGDSAGVCVWEPPGTWKLPVREQLSLLPAMLRVFGRNLPRLLGTLSAVERNHPTEPHFYLAFVGVDPDSQGRGMGSILMHPVVQRCDAEGVPAYLEASAPRNRALYERHGFEVTEEIRPGRGGPPMWRMWRDPR